MTICRKVLLHVQGDIGVQVSAEVLGIKECAVCVERMESLLSIPDRNCNPDKDLEFGRPRCVCNNEVKYNEGKNTTKFIS